MPFFPDSFWGLAYLTALVIFGAITWAGPNLAARRILAVLALHWLATRVIVSVDHGNFALWILQDVVICVVLLVFCQGLAARAIAGLFLVVLTFDNYSLVTGGSFEGAAAVAEACGYLSMLIMAGDAHADRGRIRNNLRVLFSGNALGRFAGEVRGQPKRRAEHDS